MHCTCSNGHHDQVKEYPVGSRVVAIDEIDNHPAPLPVGTFGTVTYHCDDGRASIKFDGDSGGHTFHFPDQNIAIMAPWALALEAQNATLLEMVARLCRHLDEHIIVTRRAAEQLSNNVRPTKDAELAILDARAVLAEGQSTETR